MYNKFSFFYAPIRPYRDWTGQHHPSSLVPACEVDLLSTYAMIRSDERLKSLTEQLRSLNDEAQRREFKSTYMPFVTPCGTFVRRNARKVVGLSGLIVLDVDHLSNLEVACRVRDRLFDDPLLQPSLAFVSPSGLGVKLFVSYIQDDPKLLGHKREDFERDGFTPTDRHLDSLGAQTLIGMNYLNTLFANESMRNLTHQFIECDVSGKDVSRACFLAFDPNAKLRTPFSMDNGQSSCKPRPMKLASIGEAQPRITAKP